MVIETRLRHPRIRGLHGSTVVRTHHQRLTHIRMTAKSNCATHSKLDVMSSSQNMVSPGAGVIDGHTGSC